MDRAPIDFGGTRQSGIFVWAYARLRERLGVASNRLSGIFDSYQMLAEIEQDVAERFGADCVALNRPAVAFGILNQDWEPFVFPDGMQAEVPGEFNPVPSAQAGYVFCRRVRCRPRAASPSARAIKSSVDSVRKYPVLARQDRDEDAPSGAVD